MIDWLFRVLCCAIFQPYNCRNVKLSLMWGKERGHFKCQKIKLDYHIQIQCVYNCLTINLVQKFSMHIPYNFNVSRQPLINWLNEWFQAFGSWLFHFLLHSLYPGSAFARRTTALSILSLLVHILNPGNNRGKRSISSMISDLRTLLLISCLKKCFTSCWGHDLMVKLCPLVLYCELYLEFM